MAGAQSGARQSRHQKLAVLIEREDLGALLLRRPPNFAWYTGGGDNRVDHSSPVGVAGVLVTPTSEYVVTSNIEAARLRATQVHDLEIVEHSWELSVREAIQRVIGSSALGTDASLEGAREIAGIDELRYVLDGGAIEQYRAVGADADAALDEAEAALLPGMTELEAAGIVAGACRVRDLFAPVVLVAGDERIREYRHPIPTRATIHSHVMLVLCAERFGLYANLTRFVHFDDPGSEWREREATCRSIRARMRNDATRPGRTLGDAFADCRRYYAEVGFPNEWKLHHQGGLTGYASREVVATPDSRLQIEAGHAFAWNPSITGAKAEETFVLTASGPEIVAAQEAPDTA